MKVILQQTVLKLGKAGDIVEASDGYYRNFLQPRKLAVVATAGTLKKREEDLEVIRKKAEAAHKSAQELAEKINGLDTLKIVARVGDGGKLYGKITHKEIAQLIEDKVGQPIDKRGIKCDDINAIGMYKIQVKLAPEVQAETSLEVTFEGQVQTAKAAAPAVSEDDDAEA
jgi:large subunit ribosomal protein L9